MTQKVLVLSLLLLTAARCKKDKKADPDPSPLPVFEPQLPDYHQLFYRSSGWIGGDVSSSIPLSQQKTLWLYGDSWKGSIENNKRTNYSFTAHNTIAIQDGHVPGNASVEYYFGSRTSGSFFMPEGGGWLWPLHGTMIHSELYLFFVQADTASGGLGFQLVKSTLIKISNPLDPPAQWVTTYYQVPHAFFSANRQVVFGAQVLQKDGYLYIYGTETDNTVNNRYLLLARVKPDSLCNFPSWRFYSQGQWTSNYQLAARLTNRVGFEFSVSLLPKKNKFVLGNADLGFSRSIGVQFADSLWGSWSTPETVYECPEPAWGDGIFCYAAKGHPELSAENELIITYVANSTRLNDVIGDARLYWPRFIKTRF